MVLSSAASSFEVVVAITVVLAIHFLWYFILHPTYFSPLRNIPALKVDWHTRLYRWIYNEPNPDLIESWIARSPPNSIARYPGIGGTPRVLVLSNDAVHEVLVSKAYDDFQKPPINRQRLGALFGEGLLVSDGQEHKEQRRKLLPAFAPRHIRTLTPTLWKKACELVRLLQKHLDETGTHQVELAQWTSRASLDIIGVAAWGRDFDALSNPHSTLVSKYHRMFRGSPKANRQAKFIYAAGLLIPMKTLRQLFPCEFFRNAAEGSHAIRNACASIIKDKRAQKPEAKDILSHIMATGSFDDEALIQHMLNVLAAGHETSSLSITWACYLLAKHQEKQDRLRKELRASALFSTDREAIDDLESLTHLPYLQAVTRESLRLIPTAPVLRREAVKDTTLQGHLVPKGSSIIALVQVLNTQPEVWGTDAKDFKPERWLDANTHTIDNPFFTFNIGPRSCIGEGFARIEVAVLLAALVARFRIALSDSDAPVDVIWGITLKPVSLLFELTAIS